MEETPSCAENETSENNTVQKRPSTLDIPAPDKLTVKQRWKGTSSSLCSQITESGRSTPITMFVERPVFTHAEFDKVCEPTERKSKGPREWAHHLKKKCCVCSRDCLVRTLLKRLPFINILRNYSVQEDLLSDIISGLTVGVMHIPQGKLLVI